MSDLLIYVIADYGELHDLAFAEVTQKLYAELADINVNIKTFAVPAFDTVATGFVLAQTALNSRLGKRHKFYVNTAPRRDDLSPRVSNSGEGLAYVRLYNDVEVVAVNSGYSLSFLKDSAREMREINCSREGSQFRSRDIFPPAFGRIVHGNHSELGGDIKTTVPDFPRNVVCYTDGYGNLKCSIDPNDIASLKGQETTVQINGRQQEVKVAEGIFGVADGEFCFSLGSSGWLRPDGQKIQFAEVIRRGGSAAQAFNHPRGGSGVKWA